MLDSVVALLLVQPLAWGKLDRQPATGYLLGQVTMPCDQKDIVTLLRIENWNHWKMEALRTMICCDVLEHACCTCGVNAAGCVKLRLWVDESILLSDISLPDRTDVTLLAIPAGPME